MFQWSSHHLERARAALAFLLPAGLVLYYALRGGSYDIAVRQEEALVAWWLIGLGFALGLLPRAAVPGGFLVPVVSIGLLAVLTAISLSWTESDERTLAELARVLHYTAIPVLIWSLVDARTWRAVAGGLTLGAAAVCGLALASRLYPDAFPADDIARVFDLHRLNYPFDYWNALAAWGAMTIAMLLSWSAHAERLVTRVVACAAIPPCAVAVYLTYSRAGAAAIALGVAAVIALGRNRWQSGVHGVVAAAASGLAILVVRSEDAIADGAGTAGRGSVLTIVCLASLACAGVIVATHVLNGERWRLGARAARAGLAAAATALVVVAVAGGVAYGPDAWDDFKNLTPAELDPSRSDDPAARFGTLGGNRYHLWKGALEAFEQEPVSGLGPGTFEFWWSRTTPLRTFERDAHSVYLEQLAELGVPGLLFTLSFLGGLLVVALRRPSEVVTPGAAAASGCAAAFVVFLFYAAVDWVWEVTAITVLALAAIALTASARASARRPVGIGGRAAVAVVAVIACLIQLPALASSSEVKDSQAAFRAGNLEAATAHANEAVDAQPWAASGYVQRGLVAEARGDLDGAAADLQRAVSKERTNWRHRVLLARIEAERGRTRAALAAFRAARRLRPKSAFLSGPPG